MKLILLRHGESQWNLENKFTGWTDVDLTQNGILEAQFSGNQILKKNIKVDNLHTSFLKRAIHTARIVSEIIGFNIEDIQYDWRLNERHYGALQGLNKSETATKYGEKQVHIWRRSYDIPPPLLQKKDNKQLAFSKKFKKIDQEIPCGESLSNVVERLNPFLTKYFNMIKAKPGNYLIVAHSNSLRAIIKILDKLSEEEIIEVNIPTGVPLIYEFNNDFNIINKEYLIDEETLKMKEEVVKKQGKAH